MTWTTSRAGVAFIKAEEGLRLEPYVDAVGIRTVGYGHARWTGGPITQELAEALLQDDLRPVLGCINSRITAPLTQPMVDALCSFLFNCGVGALVNTHVENAINTQNYHMAGDFMLEWCHGPGGVVLPVLKARRERERALFLSEMPPERVSRPY